MSGLRSARRCLPRVSASPIASTRRPCSALATVSPTIRFRGRDRCASPIPRPSDSRRRRPAPYLAGATSRPSHLRTASRTFRCPISAPVSFRCRVTCRPEPRTPTMWTEDARSSGTSRWSGSCRWMFGQPCLRRHEPRMAATPISTSTTRKRAAATRDGSSLRWPARRKSSTGRHARSAGITHCRPRSIGHSKTACFSRGHIPGARRWTKPTTTAGSP